MGWRCRATTRSPICARTAQSGQRRSCGDVEGRGLAFFQRRPPRRVRDEPQAYAPQYGGYCAWSVSRGRIASADPEAFAVIDDKLYLTHSQAVRSIWARDPAGFIAGADAHWPALLDD